MHGLLKWLIKYVAVLEVNLYEHFLFLSFSLLFPMFIVRCMYFCMHIIGCLHVYIQIIIKMFIYCVYIYTE